ncbi:MAG: 1-acyl-sn-glycerol-3-phosphate acyltransferase [Hahellaceae bacterium]|nr:1-acyl-sn-glycerol-3-phosphate acyltransferase [Hahellaceae bacterium]
MQPLMIRDTTIFDGVIFKRLLRTLYAIWFRLAGWKTINVAPQSAGITIAAPHTSNWDIIYALGAALLSDVKIYFSIKESWCRAPIVGRMMLWLGAIPIDRSRPNGQVELIRLFIEKHKDKCVYFLFTPEGTRGKVDRWKTGFYHVAEATGLPIFLSEVDYLTKTAGVFHSFKLTGEKDADISAIQESYKSIRGRYPELQYPPYSGPLRQISQLELQAMKAIYALKGLRTLAEITARAKLNDITTETLGFLLSKGLIEREGTVESGFRYRLTLAGNGYLLHLTPTLG